MEQQIQENIESRVLTIEEKLVEQEHRTVNILYNFFILRKKWPINDPRRDAALKAIIWKLLFSPVSAIAASGILTIAILLYQNEIMSDQNELIREQNLYFQKQIEKQNEQTALQKSQIEEQRLQWISQRRAELISTLYGEGMNIRARTEALHAFIQLERNGDSKKIVNLESINLESTDLSNTDLSNINLSHSNLKNTILRNVNFTNSNLESANLENADIQNTIFNNAKMIKANLTKVRSIGLSGGWENAIINELFGITSYDEDWLKKSGATIVKFAPMPPSYINVTEIGP